MAWDYAELSKMAKQAGGPESLMNQVVEASKKAGKIEMIPWLVLTTVASPLAVAGAKKLVEYFKNLKDEANGKIEEAKQEIINGIKEYDEANGKLEDAESAERVIDNEQ